MIERKQSLILDTFDKMFPDAHCELHHETPFQLLVAVILSAQTTDQSVNKITPELFHRFPDAYSLAQADIKELEELIHSIGLYRNKAKNIKLMSMSLVENFDGKVPQTFKEITTLPGVGRKTANVVLADAFQVPGLGVDTHVERISKRLGFAKKDDSVTDVERKLKRTIPRDRWIKTHHQMIFFGRYHCSARNPHCKDCPLISLCKYEKKSLSQ